MRNARFRKAVGAAAVGLGLLTLQLAATAPAGATTHNHHPSGGYVCSGGVIPAGSYGSIVVTGICSTPAGTVWVHHDLVVAPGAMLDAVTPGDPIGAPVVPATLHVGGDVWVGKGAALLMGCSPNISCANPPGVSFDTVGGDLRAFGAQGVVLHNVAVRGDVSIIGGGGGAAADTCAAQIPGTPTNTALAPWSLNPSLYYTPVYTDVEDTTVGGNLKVTGLDTCWLGVIRSQIWGDAKVMHNYFGDPDAPEIVTNLIGGNLGCWGNTPAPQFGDSAGAPSIVGHYAWGQCSFDTTMPNPAPDAGGPGIAVHISVKASHLATSTGTYTATPAVSLPSVTTSGGDTVGANIYSFTLAGGGLTGTGTYDSSKPPGASGAAILSTTFPNGWSSFMGYLTCDCSFGGETGTVTMRVYGTTSPSGVTTGTFLVTSGGALTPGNLASVSAYGTFTSKGQPAGTLKLCEHVAIL